MVTCSEACTLGGVGFWVKLKNISGSQALWCQYGYFLWCALCEKKLKLGSKEMCCLRGKWEFSITFQLSELLEWASCRFKHSLMFVLVLITAKLDEISNWDTFYDNCNILKLILCGSLSSVKVFSFHSGMPMDRSSFGMHLQVSTPLYSFLSLLKQFWNDAFVNFSFLHTGLKEIPVKQMNHCHFHDMRYSTNKAHCLLSCYISKDTVFSKNIEM